jgi:cytochrome c oxidase subunit IV
MNLNRKTLIFGIILTSLVVVVLLKMISASDEKEWKRVLGNQIEKTKNSITK